MPIYSNALAQRPANMLAYQDTLSATQRNEYLGALADLIAQSYSPQRTQQMQGTARFLSMPAISQTLDRLSYGEPLTTGAGGLGGTTRIRPEALEAAMAVAPAAQPATMATLQAARAARQAAMKAGMAGERYAEMVVPQIMERGGLPAQLLQDLAQGTRRQVFVGEKSKTWNATNAAKAVEMEKAGAKPEDIWMATGTFRGPEGKLRQEISDVPATLLNNQKNFEGKLHETLSHPELFENYPGLQYYHTDITSEIALPEHLKKTLIGRGSGSFTEKSFPYGEPKITAQAYSPEDKGTLLHEIQHAVQAKEGFARGGSPGAGQDAPFVYGVGEASKRLKEIEFLLEKTPYGTNQFDDLIREQASLAKTAEAEAAMEGYRRLAGEAEARAVQSRMNMTPQERLATFPYESYDVPVNQLIVRTK